MTDTRTNLIAFPFCKRPATECADPREAIFQLKLEAAQMLNDVVAGRYIMSKENIETIPLINKLCREVGLTPLDFELSD